MAPQGYVVPQQKMVFRKQAFTHLASRQRFQRLRPFAERLPATDPLHHDAHGCDGRLILLIRR